MIALFKKNTLSLLLLISAVSPTIAHSASFNCNRATTAAEFAICGNEQLSSLDDSLAVEYRRAVLRNPTIKKFQQDWLNGPRKECGAQITCLVNAYQQQLEVLRKDSGASDSGVHAPTLSANNPIPILFNSSVIYNSSSLLNESYWSDAQHELFGKPVTEWTDNDFSYLEFRLNKELAAELEEIVGFNKKYNLKTPPEDSSVYQARARDIHRFIDSIPRFKYWIQQANIKMIAQEKQQQQRLVDEKNIKVEQEKAEKTAHAEIIKRNEIQAEKIKANNIILIIFLALAAAAALVIWHKFIRKRCSRCQSLNFIIDDITEVDRFRGHIKVREKHSKGVNTRAISATLVINKYDYRCKDCGHQWFEKKKEEPGANL